MIVLKLIFWGLNLILWAADIALLVYVVMNILRVRQPLARRIRQYLALVCEPLLIPARRLLARFLPSRFMILDWSPILVWILLGILRNLLGVLERIIL